MHFWYNWLIRTLVFERQERRHFTDGISSWNLVIHDQPSLVFLNNLSYQSLKSLMWHVRHIDLEMLCQDQMFTECNNLEGICCILLFLLIFCASFCYIIFSCDQAALRSPLSVCLSVCLSVTPFSLCYCHRMATNFSEVITNDKSDVNAKDQGHRSKVKVTEVITQLSRFRTVTPVWIHIWWQNDA